MPADDDERTLRVRLDLHLDRRPIRGRLRTEWGADERFVGWLGFVDALKRLHEVESRRTAEAGQLPVLRAAWRTAGPGDNRLTLKIGNRRSRALRSEPIDSLAVTTLVDNVTDMLLVDEGPATRPSMALATAPASPRASSRAARPATRCAPSTGSRVS